MSGQIRALAAELCEVIDNEYSELRMTKTKLFEELEQERQALQAEYQTKFAELAEMEKEITRKGESLEKLEQLNLAFVGRDNDVLKLNVSGEMFQLHVLHFSRMRWDENIEKDAEGNYFLDLDPWGFGVLLTYFREKGMETPESPAVFPFVPREKRDSFLNLLEYLGLRAYLEVRDPADIDKTCSNSSWWRWRLSRRKSPSSPPSPQLASRASNATPTQERNTRNNRSPPLSDNLRKRCTTQPVHLRAQLYTFPTHEANRPPLPCGEREDFLPAHIHGVWRSSLFQTPATSDS
eukprot:GEMP01067518.1.p1 GENE.GEMP01067518.1~~GEMP01067518.1.p1  ORF type:complete len:293 (+),score=59.56 GEMP01067518.1:218-1096(+)